jgi:hypothetical protein
LKLDPAVGDLLGYERTALVPLHRSEMRQGLRVAANFAEAPLPLALIYLLTPEADGMPLQPQDVLIELVRNSFPTRLLRSGGAPHLQQCVRLMKYVRVMKLRLQDARVSSAELSGRVLADLAAAGADQGQRSPAET